MANFARPDPLKGLAPVARGAEDLRDIHGYHAFEVHPAVWWILGIIIAGTLGYFIYKYIKSRKPKVEATNFQAALFKLDKLDLKQSSKDFYLNYSEIIKLYLGEEFSRNYMDKTNEELKPLLMKEEMMTTTQVLTLTKSLMRGDLAKFARKEVSPDEKSDDIKVAKILINDINEAIEAKKALEAAKKEINDDEEFEEYYDGGKNLKDDSKSKKKEKAVSASAKGGKE